MALIAASSLVSGLHVCKLNVGVTGSFQSFKSTTGHYRDVQSVMVANSM